MGLLRALTATATAADTAVSAAVAVGASGAVAEGRAEGVDGISLEAEPDMGVDGGGDTDVGVASSSLMTTSSTPCSKSRVVVVWRTGSPPRARRARAPTSAQSAGR